MVTMPATWIVPLLRVMVPVASLRWRLWSTPTAATCTWPAGLPSGVRVWVKASRSPMSGPPGALLAPRSSRVMLPDSSRVTNSRVVRSGDATGWLTGIEADVAAVWVGDEQAVMPLVPIAVAAIASARRMAGVDTGSSLVAAVGPLPGTALTLGVCSVGRRPSQDGFRWWGSIAGLTRPRSMGFSVAVMQSLHRHRLDGFLIALAVGEALGLALSNNAGRYV